MGSEYFIEVEEPKYADRVQRNIVLTFSRRFFPGCIEDLEVAWDYYENLSVERQKLFRQFSLAIRRAKTGVKEGEVVDFEAFLDILLNNQECGTACRVGKSILLRKVREHICTLGEEERIKYLNGRNLGIV
jgi:hypothetical protein